MFIVDQLQKDDPKLRILAFGALVGLLTLLGGLWYVQVIASRRYQSSLQTQTYRSVRVPGIRGKITDRNGVILAENRPNYSLDLYLEELRPKFDEEFRRLRGASKSLTRQMRAELRVRSRLNVASNAVTQVGRVLGQPMTLNPKAFQRHHEEWPYRPLPLVENMTPEQVARYFEQSGSLPGVDLEVQPIRFYPFRQGVAHILGYLARDDFAVQDDEWDFNYSLPSYEGRIGVEHAFNKELTGKSGLKTVVVNSLCYRTGEGILNPPEPGENLVLTLDWRIQKAAFDALSTGPRGQLTRGAVIVVEVNTGDILAMVSLPAYDPNRFLRPIDAKTWREELDDPELKQTFNRATQGAYQPGSVFKIITALSALESGALTPETVKDSFQSPGYYLLGRRVIKDEAAPGTYDFRRAFIKSSNTYFINFGLKAGLSRLLHWGREFGLGESLDLPTQQTTRGQVPPYEKVAKLWTEGEAANVCMGQQITVTPMHVAMMTAAIANGGKLFAPRLVERIEPAELDASGTGAQTLPPRLRRQIPVNPRHLEIIREAMLADTDDPEGTGYKGFHVQGRPLLREFRVGGKTGTAQVKDEHNQLKDHITWFTCFGPAEKPKYAVVVMVESGSSGGRDCAPVAGKIFQTLENMDSGVGHPHLAQMSSQEANR